MTSRRIRRERKQNTPEAALAESRRGWPRPGVPIRVPDCGEDWPDAMIWSPPAGEVRAEP